MIGLDTFFSIHSNSKWKLENNMSLESENASNVLKKMTMNDQHGWRMNRVE